MLGLEIEDGLYMITLAPKNNCLWSVCGGFELTYIWSWGERCQDGLTTILRLGDICGSV